MPSLGTKKQLQSHIEVATANTMLKHRRDLKGARSPFCRILTMPSDEYRMDTDFCNRYVHAMLLSIREGGLGITIPRGKPPGCVIKPRRGYLCQGTGS